MKLVRIGPAGQERPAVLADDGSALDLTGLTDDVDGTLLATGLATIREAVANGDLPRPAAVAQPRAPTERHHRRHDLRGPTPGLVHQPVPGVAARRHSQHGHPGRVAVGRPGGGYLRAGETMRLEIDGLGAQQQTLGPA